MKEKNKEFRIGDQVAILATVDSVSPFSYVVHPIKLSIAGGGVLLSCTRDGRYSHLEKNQNVFHMEDIQPKNEFPKWMEVKTEAGGWIKRKVIYKDETGYVFIMWEHEAVSYGVEVVKEAREIEPENIIKRDLLNKANELIEKANELKQQAEKL